MSSASDYSLPNRPTQTAFYPGEVPITLNDTLQRKFYNTSACAEQGQMSSNNAVQNNSYGTYKDVVLPNNHCDSYRERSLQNRFYDDPAFLQAGRDNSNIKHNNISQQRHLYKFTDQYGYNHIQPNNHYDKYTVPCSNPYSPSWNGSNEVSHTSPYNIYTDQINSKNILKSSPYNTYTEQRNLTNISQTSPYNPYTDYQRIQSNAYKTRTDQINLQNNFYEVFPENTPQTDLFNIYLDQRDINSSTENNVCAPYKEDYQTETRSNTYTNQCHLTNGQSTNTNPYNVCVNQISANNGSRINLFSNYYADCFKCNPTVNNMNTAPQNNFYRSYSDQCPTPPNQTPRANFYDSYPVPFSIALTQPASQTSPQTHHNRSSTTPLNTSCLRNGFSRQKWTDRRLDVPACDLDNQPSQRYVVMRQIIPERSYVDAKKPEWIHRPQQVCPKKMKKAANDIPAVAIAKNKHQSTQQRLGNAHKKSKMSHMRKLEKLSHALICGQDVMLSRHVIDDDELIQEMEGIGLKKRGRPLKKISARLMKCARKPFRDAVNARTKTSPKWGERSSEKVKTKTGDMYSWDDDFSLEEINNAERSPSSLFLRLKSKDILEKSLGIIREEELEDEESQWIPFACYQKINDLKAAWKILMLEPIFPNLIY